MNGPRKFELCHFQHRPGYSSVEGLRHFRWLLKGKAKWLRDGKRVKRQKFFDALWYTAGWILNKNPYCLCWAIVDQRGSTDRAVFIKWGSHERPILRVDKMLYSYEDFQYDPLGLAQAASENLRLLSEAMSSNAAYRGQTPIRRPKGPQGPSAPGQR